MLLVGNGPDLQLINMQCNRENKKIDLKYSYLFNEVRDIFTLGTETRQYCRFTSLAIEEHHFRQSR